MAHGVPREAARHLVCAAALAGVLVSCRHGQAAYPRSSVPRRLALLVGISKYAAHGGPHPWWDLHGTNDIDALRTVLVERLGFASGDVLVLRDEQATRQGIVDAFNRHLVDRARPGDVALFHFSGHGQQVLDDTGLELDGLRETLVPYDYISQAESDGRRTNLRDETIGQLLDRLRAKVGTEGSITVFLDSCFSGNATRAMLTPRGRPWDPALDGGEKPAPRPAGRRDSPSGLLEAGQAAADHYVVIAASRSDQLAREYVDEDLHWMGGLTYFLVRALAASTPATTYRSLFERVSFDVTSSIPSQQPQLEGADVDEPIFSRRRSAAASRATKTYVDVVATEGGRLAIPAGKLQGASVGSIYALYRAGSSTANASDLLAEAEVVAVEDLRSWLLLTGSQRDRSASDFAAARAVERAHSYMGARLRVRRSSPDLALPPLDIIEVVDAAAAAFDLGAESAGGEVRLTRTDGSLVAAVPAGDATKLEEALVRHWRWSFLGSLRNPAPDLPIKLEVKLVPVTVTAGTDGQTERVDELPELAPTEGHRLSISNCTNVVIRVRNPGSAAGYVTLLQFGPQGDIEPVYPDDEHVTDNRLAAGQAWQRLNPKNYLFQVTTPGHYVLKGFITSEPTSFRTLFDQGRNEADRRAVVDASRGLTNPLAELLFHGALGRRTRAVVAPIFWTTSELEFDVLPDPNRPADCGQP